MGKDFVSVTIDEDLNSTRVHLPNSSHASDYVTLCGLDGGVSDEGQAHEFVSGPVTCSHCIAIWKHCRKYRVTDFDRRKLICD